MLNFATFHAADMRDEPFRWGTVTSAFVPGPAARAVADDFPVQHLRLRESTPGSDKTYRMLTAPLVEHGKQLSVVELLADPWRELVGQLVSRRFTETMSEAGGVRLSESSVEVRAAGYADGCFLSPHTDRPDKLLSLILYLEPVWSEPDGGELSILRSSDPTSEVCRVQPRLGTAAILVRSDRSWHQVLPVRQPASGYRRSVLVHYWRGRP
jgi:SM-20-related protein